MNFSTFILILIGVLFNALAQLILKKGSLILNNISISDLGFFKSIFTIGTDFYILSGIACYIISVGIWIIALSKVEVSVAYPMLSIGYVVNLFGAWYLFGEQLTSHKILGVSIIIFGVLILTKA